MNYLRAYLKYSPTEMEIFEEVSRKLGYTTFRKFVYAQLNNTLTRLPELNVVCGKKTIQSINISDPELINKIEQYCEAFNITQSSMVQRLINPFVLPHLLEEGRDVVN